MRHDSLVVCKVFQIVREPHQCNYQNRLKIYWEFRKRSGTFTWNIVSFCQHYSPLWLSHAIVLNMLLSVIWRRMIKKILEDLHILLYIPSKVRVTFSPRFPPRRFNSVEMQFCYGQAMSSIHSLKLKVQPKVLTLRNFHLLELLKLDELSISRSCFFFNLFASGCEWKSYRLITLTTKWNNRHQIPLNM